ncbi:MAG: SIR2 family protein [Chitinispirillaceae bacterium]|nr:SIR2 family protein [Chitinispirillaceae bacterium]
MKKKLLIIAGAGASIDFGMPSVNDVDRLFHKWALEHYPLASFDEGGSLFSYVKREIEQHMGRASQFEEVLYVLFMLDTLTNSNQRQNALGAFIAPKSFPQIDHFRCELKQPEGFLFNSLACNLIDRLLKEFRGKCLSVSETHGENFDAFKAFMSQLDSEFETGVVTPNYDNLILQSLPDLFTGFDPGTGCFNPESVYSRTDWRFCYHVHGSVHFNQESSVTNMHEIHWQDDLSATFQHNSSGRNSITTTEGWNLPTSAIITGYDKASQILGTPFRTYYSQIEKKVLEADAVLFLGYGFNDLHINRCFDLYRRVKPGRKIVVVDYATDWEDPLQFRCDQWSHNIFGTLRFNGHEMGAKERGEFEMSRNPKYPLAIWYGGMLSACHSYDKIAAELNGE